MKAGTEGVSFGALPVAGARPLEASCNHYASCNHWAPCNHQAFDHRSSLSRHQTTQRPCHTGQPTAFASAVTRSSQACKPADTGVWPAVHYTGTLQDGTKFDSSVDRGQPLTFSLGIGEVIKGWDMVVASMKKGEKVEATLHPDYAYGAKGSPPTIPASATLVRPVRHELRCTVAPVTFGERSIVSRAVLPSALGTAFRSTRQVWRAVNSGEAPSKPGNAAFSGAVHGPVSGQC